MKQVNALNQKENKSLLCFTELTFVLLYYEWKMGKFVTDNIMGSETICDFVLKKRKKTRKI